MQEIYSDDLGNVLKVDEDVYHLFTVPLLASDVFEAISYIFQETEYLEINGQYVACIDISLTRGVPILPSDMVLVNNTLTRSLQYLLLGVTDETVHLQTTKRRDHLQASAGRSESVEES